MRSSLQAGRGFPSRSIVVVEHGAVLPVSWVRPRADVILLKELTGEPPEMFAQRAIRSISELAKSAVIAEVRLFAAQSGSEERLRARSAIARALLAAMRYAPAPCITLVAGQDRRAQHDLFALADAVRTEASTNVSVRLKLRGPDEELDEPAAAVA